ncbi:Gfo/Idh/MocA family protein [Taibaiella koreensis]|uniref:Gfo/Idh/MocA family protein n=1 Tax=Taibaiella koreensis TaxID=1268548 RepID=UPI000E5A0122|nr:Gfo/Idh/MocA family oxidoreductase [Taibaiella koreensis]
MLKVGVFGAGHLGKIHIQQWLEIPGVTLVGFYDPNDDHAAGAITQYQVKRYADPEALIAAADALDIVTNTTSHFEIAKACLLQSRHLFIEKPMTHTMAEARELVKLVSEANVKCQIGHVERYNPAMLALRNRKLEPMFIETHRLAQFNPRGTDVAVILDLMIHDIDIILHLVKSPVRRISASGVAVISDTADIANARIEFDNGCVANLTASRISLKKMRKMRLFQRDAYIGIDFLEKKTEIIRMKGEEEERGFFDFPIELGEGRQKIISIDTPNVKPVNSIREELADFALSVLQDKPVNVSVYDGLHAMDVAHQILQKMIIQMNPEANEKTMRE